MIRSPKEPSPLSYPFPRKRAFVPGCVPGFIFSFNFCPELNWIITSPPSNAVYKSIFTFAFISPEFLSALKPPVNFERAPCPNKSRKKELNPPPLPKLPKSNPSKGEPPPNPPPLAFSKASALRHCSPYWSYFLRFSGSPITSYASLKAWNFAFAFGSFGCKSGWNCFARLRYAARTSF